VAGALRRRAAGDATITDQTETPTPAGEPKVSSRRQFMAATAKLASASWIAMHWPQIAAAAEPMTHMSHEMAAPPAVLKTLTAAEAAEVEAIANQIVPGGANPGARDAHALYFIDNALGGFFADQLPAFRKGLAEFNAGFGPGRFSAAPEAEQIAYLHKVDKTPFFAAVRRLTVLGLLALPKYGGNHEGLGSKLIGVVDRHVWTPPFGYYDRDYPGFAPYPGTKIVTA
jgi:hypothetical protein